MNSSCMFHLLRRFFILAFFSALTTTALSENVRRHFEPSFPGLEERLYITEVCVIPPAGSDWPAWVEIWNNSRQPVDLRGYSLETLQTRLAPFAERFVVEPDGRCIVLAYPGEKTCAEFEAKLPADAKSVRCFGVTLFPPYFPMDEWRSLLSKHIPKESANKPMSDEQLGKHISVMFGTTRYINELALRNQNGELVAFLYWGRKPGQMLSNITKAAQEAVKMGIFRDRGVDFFPFDAADSEGVLQMKRPGTYLALCYAAITCTPGAPLLRKPTVPVLTPPIDCGYSGDEKFGTVVELKFDIQRLYVDSWLEGFWGWSGIVPEFFYDQELTKPVFASRVEFHPSLLKIDIKPLDFLCLTDRPLYARLAKFHATEPPVYSAPCEVTLPHITFPDIHPLASEYNPRRPRINIDRAAEEVEKIREYFDKCAAIQAKYRASSIWMNFSVIDSGREVIIKFIRDHPQLADISPLAGLPIRKLDISNSKVECLDALKGMSLVELNLRRTAVKDISALKGMPLEVLNISGTDITDVSPLFGAPLKRLIIDDIRNKIGNVDALIDEDMEVKKETANRTIILDFIRTQK